MRVLQKIEDFRRERRAATGSVGLVPTMGYLHEGHLTLVRRARAENDVLAVSIFVNPAQFGPQEDFATYPRDMDRDLSLLQAEGTDLVFAPSTEEMYPGGFSTWVEVTTLTDRLEGAARPGHFRGVATVVAKLFGTVQPHIAYFGQKDAQQAVVVKRMVADLNIPVEIRVVPTVREHDGLALSSRNVYLSPEERKAALSLSQGLFRAGEKYLAGERNAELLRQAVRDVMQEQPIVRPEYVSVAASDTLEELDVVTAGALVSLAAHVGRSRLIDNVLLE